MVKLCTGHYAKLYSYQNSLPRMPVPNLSDTCKGLLRSVKPILEEEEYKKMEALSKVGLQISMANIQFITGTTKITELSSISWLIDLHSSSYWARNLSFKWKFQASESECLQTGWFLNLSFSSKFPLQTLTVMLNKTLPTINGWEAWWPSVSMLDSGN